MQTNLVWHYTTGEKFLRIAESGMLLPTGIGVTPPEKPVLWFSRHQFFEPTAVKAVMERGRPRRCGIAEMRELGGGLVRFGYAQELLHGDSALRAVAKISRAVWRRLQKEARVQGGNPADWFGTLESLHIADLVIDVMDDTMNWVTMTTPLLMGAKRPMPHERPRPVNRVHIDHTLTSSKHNDAEVHGE